MDDAYFSHKATMKLCSSLDIEHALKRCLQFINNYIPADQLVLDVFVPELYAMRVIAHISLDEVKKLSEITPIPKDAWHDYAWKDGESIKILNHPGNQTISQLVSNYLEKPEISIMVMRIKIDGDDVGNFSVFANGLNQFNEEHARLLSLLNGPITLALSNALKHYELQNLKKILADENRYLRNELLDFAGNIVIGEEFGLRQVMEMVRQVASSNTPVLISGETGVGKEVIADVIHACSSRRNKTFIKVNCGAIPEHLVDSELFGHEKGAFTGALSRKPGRLERAHRGSLLLDEIGDLPLSSQTRLLRVLQDEEIERVGGTRAIPVDCRVISATHRDLKKMVSEKTFRQDLFFRLNVFPIFIPPLRKRKEDIPALVDHFLTTKSKKLKVYNIPPMAKGSIEKLMDYDWPGNIRELENIVEKALIQIRGRAKNQPLVFDTGIEQYDGYIEEIVQNHMTTPFKLDDAVTACIQGAMTRARGKVEGSGGAAEILGLNPHTLRSKMKKLGIPYGRRK